MKKKYVLLLCSLAFVVFAGTSAFADAIIQSGNVYLGVNDEGHLNVVDTPDVNPAGGWVGLTYARLGDATSPGCLCEGWGVSGSGVSGYANIDVDGVQNLTVDSFTSTASTATSTVHLTNFSDLVVTQAYAPAPESASVFENTVTITNTSGSTMTNIEYVRVMDWDIPPTEFNEYVTIQGTATTTDLLTSHDNGFASANPLAVTSPMDPATLDVDFVDNGPADHGAYFNFGFGDLAAGESITFSVYYGATANEADALSALGLIGAELYSLGQSSGDPTGGTPATFLFAFSGVGGTPIVDPVPEPSTFFLIGAGLMSLGFIQRKKRR